MPQIKLVEHSCPVPSSSTPDILTEVIREGARKMLAAALNAEVEEYLQQYSADRDSQGHRQAVHNGFLPQRTILTGVGPLEVRQPRVEDRGLDERGEKRRFRSKILPPYLRKTRAIEDLIPWLYLKGISTGDFAEALAALLGPDAKGLSANTVTRLKDQWAEDFKHWNHRSLRDKRYVYFWVDGVYFNVRLEEDRACVLVIIAATEDGTKELLAVHDGFRESELSWRELLLHLKRRGRSRPTWRLVTGLWDSGQPCRRFFRRPGCSGVGCTKPPTY